MTAAYWLITYSYPYYNQEGWTLLTGLEGVNNHDVENNENMLEDMTKNLKQSTELFWEVGGGPGVKWGALK